SSSYTTFFRSWSGIFRGIGQEVLVPAGRCELHAFAGRQSHENVYLVAARVHDGQQTLPHLLLLIGVYAQRYSGQFLEFVLILEDRRRPRIVVGKECYRLALMRPPVEVLRLGDSTPASRQKQCCCKGWQWFQH